MDSSHSSDSDMVEVNDYRHHVSRRSYLMERTNNTHLLHNSISPWNKENDGVTTLYRCDASDARALYIFDSAYKLVQSDHYDIGGVYIDSDGGAYIDRDAGLWFYFTSSSVPGCNYLMNIFVCQRKPGMFSLGISDSNNLTTATYNNEKVRILNNELCWQTFHSTQPDEVKYIKSFCFSEEDRISLLNMVLVIPISINITPKSAINKDIVCKIKAEHQFGEELVKTLELDFILISNEGTEFKVHKVVLAAHSPMLRDLIRGDCKTLSLNIGTHDIELLLQYLYTGVIKDILNQPFEVLLVIADKFLLKNLTELVKQAMKLALNSENALSTAVVAEKFNCKDVQEVAFKYIKQHPEVLDSDAFSEIDNANVVKKLLRYIHVSKS